MGSNIYDGIICFSQAWWFHCTCFKNIVSQRAKVMAFSCEITSYYDMENKIKEVIFIQWGLGNIKFAPEHFILYLTSFSLCSLHTWSGTKKTCHRNMHNRTNVMFCERPDQVKIVVLFPAEPCLSITASTVKHYRYSTTQ